MIQKIQNRQLCYFLIIVGLFYSIFNSINNTIKYDKFFTNSENKKIHHIIRTDIYDYWSMANIYKNDIEEGKPIIGSGAHSDPKLEERGYLYPKLIAFYYMLINEDMFEKNGEIKIGNYKYGIPLIQSILFYICLFFFYKKASTKFSGNILTFVILFLSLEPNLFQYHASYWTESLYLSMLLIFFSFFIDLPKQSYKYFFLGIFMGIMFMQRTVSIFLFLPVIIYLLVILKFRAIHLSILIIAGYSLILLFVGYENYKKYGLFYIVPEQGLAAHWIYVSHKLNAKKLNISEGDASKKKIEDMNKWIDENNINLKNFKDKRKLAEYKRHYFTESLKDNIFYFSKYHLYKSMQSLIISFNEVKREYTNDKSIERYYLLPEYHADLKKKILYSLIIYIISLIGLIRIIVKGEKLEKNLVFLIILICLYYISLLGWVGTGRYMVTNQIFYSIFFGFGADWVYKNVKKKLINDGK